MAQSYVNEVPKFTLHEDFCAPGVFAIGKKCLYGAKR